MGGLINAVSNAFGGGANQFNATAPKITYQARKANLPTTDYSSGIAGAAGNYGAATADQNGLIGQLQTAAAGGGPNPALAQLQQTTAANINNAAGAAASARGVNPALAARLAVDNAATANQTAAGQAATLAAQQQIAARDQLASTLATKAGTAVQALGTTGGLQNQQAGLELQNTLGTEGINAGIASANASNDLAAQQINAGVAQQNAQVGAQVFGGLLQGGGAALAGLAHGGEVKGGKTDQELAREVHEKRKGKGGRKGATPAGKGGKKLSDKELAAQVTLQRYFKNAPKKAGGGWMGAAMTGMGRALAPPPPGAAAAAPRAAPAPAPAPAGVPALLARPAPGPAAWAPSPVTTAAPAAAPRRGPVSAVGQLLRGVGQGLGPAPYARGGDVHPVFYSHGSPEVVPGRAAIPYGEDSTKGDRVPAWLTPGEIVIPRSAAQAPDAPQKAKAFVEHLVKARGPSGYRRVAEAKRKLGARA